MMQIMFQMQLLFMTGAILLLISRPLLAKFPRVISYGLWCVLFLRLLCPFSLDADSALWPMQNIVDLAEQKQQTDAMRGMEEHGTEAGRMQAKGREQVDPSGQDGTGITAQNHAVSNGTKETSTYSGQMSIGDDTDRDNKPSEVAGGGSHFLQRAGRNAGSAITNFLAMLYRGWKDHAFLLAGIWVSGMVVYLLWALCAVRKYGQYVKEATPCSGRKRVYESNQIASPFVYGIWHKKIIVPRGLAEAEREYIICHEEMHLRRKDDLIKWVVFLLNGIYWFQPMVWVAAYYLEQDMEMSCDEMVIHKLGHQIKKVYAQSLLSFAGGRAQEMLPPAFASGSVKSRIRNVLQPKRFRKWMLPVSLVLIISFVAILFTVQKDQAVRNAEPSQERKQNVTEPMPVATADRNTEEISDSLQRKDSPEKAVENNSANAMGSEKTMDDQMLPQEYVFREDVTHDGIKDTITLHMEALRDESLATGEEETVTVTSGKTGEKIASYTADTVHYGWNGIYLYEDETGKYLVEWKPMMYQGLGAFSLKVFSLKEDGTEDVVFKKKYEFNLNVNKLDFDREKYNDFINLVNSYLKNSYVIVDTDQGNVMYSTKEGQLAAPYDGSWVIDDYKELVSKKTVKRKE